MTEPTRRRRLHYQPTVREASGVDTDPDAPLWRAAQAFRLVTLVYAISYQFASASDYTNSRLSWFFVALMAVWTGVSALLLGTSGALFGKKLPRYQVVIADQVVVILLMASTRLVSDHEWYQNHQTLPTTLWATNAVISAAILGGPWLGMASGVVISAASAIIRDQVNLDLCAMRRLPCSYRSAWRWAWPPPPLGARIDNSSKPSVWRRPPKSASVWHAKYTTAFCRCWRWCAGEVRHSAARQLNWLLWPVSRRSP